jgi:hypothetical protein
VTITQEWWAGVDIYIQREKEEQKIGRVFFINDVVVFKDPMHEVTVMEASFLNTNNRSVGKLYDWTIHVYTSNSLLNDPILISLFLGKVMFTTRSVGSTDSCNTTTGIGILLFKCILTYIIMVIVVILCLKYFFGINLTT